MAFTEKQEERGRWVGGDIRGGADEEPNSESFAEKREERGRWVGGDLRGEMALAIC